MRRSPRVNDVQTLAKRIAASTYFEDRLEYDVQDLSLAYALPRPEAQELFDALHKLAKENK